jgi:hypothetical protein
MATFTLPQFNILFDVWREVLGGDVVLTHHNVAGQWYVNPRVLFPNVVLDPDEDFNSVLRMPIGTDVREEDYVEIPPGSGWWYQIIAVERIHLGFPNEYFAASSLNNEGAPLFHGAILMEDGSYVLMEDEVSKIGME